MSLTFAPADSPATPLVLLDSGDFDSWFEGQPEPVRRWIEGQGFKAKLGSAVSVPDTEGGISIAVAGLGSASTRARGRFALAASAAKLPKAAYRITSGLPADLAETECLGWLLGQYRFDRYTSQSGSFPSLVAPTGIDATRVEAMAAGEALTRDLINTPASDMTPDGIEGAARTLADRFNATLEVTTGDALLDASFPMIHAVGRASAIAPRLIDLRWGDSGPDLALVGKGVCFDTGGLNLKPGASMALMKKDMGGAATVLGLAHMIMALNLPLRLRVLIPAVENAVAGNAFRPQDILTSRKGLTVEINNTDAEGRLVLADALALADEAKPDLIISMATLTGAARVAVGPDLTPFYTDNNGYAQTLAEAGNRMADPLWRMPFHAPYEAMIEPGIADLDNAPKGGFAGSITAALFLRRFVNDTPDYVHFDIYGWQPNTAPARPKGGLGQGARAVLGALPNLLNL